MNPDDTRLRCLLVDDEPPAIAVLERFIGATDELVVAATASHAVKAFDVLSQQRIDVLFLDIQMPRLSGIDFLRSLKQPPRVIFTTASRDHALDGFDLDAVDYLMKPISFERFTQAVGKLLGRAEARLETNELTRWQQRFIFVRINREMVKINLDEIQYVESLKDYVRIVTPQKQYVVNQTLVALNERLVLGSFCRVHRSFIVALSAVTAYTRTTVVAGSHRLPIGRLYRDAVLNELAAYLPVSAEKC